MKKFTNFIHNFFIPHEGNNYRAKALHIDFLTFYLIFALFLTFGFKIINSKTGNVLGYATDITVDRLYQLTNSIRTQNQLTTLTYNEKLAQAAQKKASDMFAKNYWSHYGPDGATPWDFILASGYQYEYAGENLAKNFLFSKGVVDAWMASPSHRDNILRKDYTEVGFAIVNGVLNGEETTLVVEMFGTPLHPVLAERKSLTNTTDIRPLAAEAKDASEIQPALKKSAISTQKTLSQTNNVRKISLNAGAIFLIFLMLALIIDLYYVNKYKVVRITGKNLAHLIFIGFIFIGLFLLTEGAIL